MWSLCEVKLMSCGRVFDRQCKMEGEGKYNPWEFSLFSPPPSLPPSHSSPHHFSNPFRRISCSRSFYLVQIKDPSSSGVTWGRKAAISRQPNVSDVAVDGKWHSQWSPLEIRQWRWTFWLYVVTLQRCQLQCSSVSEPFFPLTPRIRFQRQYLICSRPAGILSASCFGNWVFAV